MVEPINSMVMKTNVDFDLKLIPMKKVLIALDYNPSAKKVAEVGFSLAKTMGAEVTLMHVIADYTYYFPADAMFEFNGFSSAGFMQKIDVEGLEKASLYYLEKIKEQLGDDSIQLISKAGDSASAILHAADDLHADLIVIGSHSRRWLDNILLGSVAKEVLSKTSIPMFIIPIKEEIK